MKAAITLLSVLTGLSNAFAGNVCDAPRSGVNAIISDFTIADNGQTFCFAKEVGTNNRFPVLDCGVPLEGTLVQGTVYTHWTHKNNQGVPVCDYKEFVIDAGS